MTPLANLLPSLFRLPAASFTREQACEQHGSYSARRLLGNLWTRCPQCVTSGPQYPEPIVSAERDQQAQRQQLQEQQWQRALEQAGIPERFRTRTFKNYEASNDMMRCALSAAENYADDFTSALRTGRSLLFCGNVGTGKTHLACAIALRIMHRQGRSVRFSTVMNAIRRVRATYQPGSSECEREALALFSQPDLLILDEVGVHNNKEYNSQLIFDLINTRYEQRKPTLLISNLPREEFRKFLGDRVYDRMREDGGEVIAFRWESHRDKAQA